MRNMSQVRSRFVRSCRILVSCVLATGALVAVELPLAAPAGAADLDHAYAPSDRDVNIQNRHAARRRSVVVEHDVDVVAAPVPVPVPVTPWQFAEPYGPLTYFPTHAPNYGYGY